MKYIYNDDDLRDIFKDDENKNFRFDKFFLIIDEKSNNGEA